jgi:hypothetical protein
MTPGAASIVTSAATDVGLDPAFEIRAPVLRRQSKKDFGDRIF